MSWPAIFERVVIRPAVNGPPPEPTGFLPDPAGIPADEEPLRPLYARVLGLNHLDPGGLLCFIFFEGTLIFGFLLALAELISWWGILTLPATVALMVKLNDLVATAVARAADRVPEQERQRFRREMQPAVGRAAVPSALPSDSAGDSGDPGHTTERIDAGRGGVDPAAAVGQGTAARIPPELATPRTRPRPAARASRARQATRDGRRLG
jgi:hypothetical protein